MFFYSGGLAEWTLHDQVTDLNTPPGTLPKMVIQNIVFETYTIFYLNGSVATFNGCHFNSWTVIEATRGAMETSQSITDENQLNPFVDQKEIVLQNNSFLEKVYINVEDTTRQVIISNCKIDKMELRLGIWTWSSTFVLVKATDSVFSGGIDILSGFSNNAILVEFITCICEDPLQIHGSPEVVLNFSNSSFKGQVFIQRAGSISFINCLFLETVLIESAVNFTFTNCSFREGVKLKGSTSATTATITNCRFSKGKVIIIHRAKVSVKHSQLRNTLLNCSKVSIQIIDSQIGNMKIYEAGNVGIINSSGGSVKIEGKETGKCCSNITVTSSRLKHSGLDRRKVSLNIVDSIFTRVRWDSYHGSRFTAVDTEIDASMKSEYVTLLSATRNTSVLRNLHFICPLKLVEDRNTKSEKIIIQCDSCEEDEYKVIISKLFYHTMQI